MEQVFREAKFPWEFPRPRAAFPVICEPAPSKHVDCADRENNMRKSLLDNKIGHVPFETKSERRQWLQAITISDCMHIAEVSKVQ